MFLKLWQHKFKTILLLLILGSFMTNQALTTKGGIDPERIKNSKQFNGKAFENKKIFQTVALKDMWPMIKAYMFEKQKPASPINPVPVQMLTTEYLNALDPSKTMLFRLGHSTLLIWLEGDFWLTDPVFSNRASPFSFAGPKRFHNPPISIDQLPNIKGVIFSHNHYDHLDKKAVKLLADKVEQFYMPIGMGGDLVKWGILPEKINEFDWHETMSVGDVELIATPSQHFSGRSMTDSNKSLWSSWVIKSNNASLFFSGDSGYFDGFKTIGEQYGPFDVSFIETGAYNELWPDVHMMPEESIQAHLDLNAKVMVPIHNGTFDLALHAWYDPFEQIEQLAIKQQVQWIDPQMGQPVELNDWPELNYWWKK